MTRLTYRQLGERLQRVKERKDAGDEATARRLRELEEIAAAAAATKQEPDRLNLIQPGETDRPRSCVADVHRR